MFSSGWGDEEEAVAKRSPFRHKHCSALLHDRSSQLHKLWGKEGWRKREPERKHDPTCWGGDGWRFFDDAWWGRDCERNWYTGNQGELGDPKGGPHFTAPAAALLGFDHNINLFCEGSDDYHAIPCVQHNYNILSLYGNAVPYNVCRNLEWQVPHCIVFCVYVGVAGAPLYCVGVAGAPLCFVGVAVGPLYCVGVAADASLYFAVYLAVYLESRA